MEFGTPSYIQISSFSELFQAATFNIEKFRQSIVQLHAAAISTPTVDFFFLQIFLNRYRMKLSMKLPMQQGMKAMKNFMNAPTGHHDYYQFQKLTKV